MTLLSQLLMASVIVIAWFFVLSVVVSLLIQIISFVFRGVTISEWLLDWSWTITAPLAVYFSLLIVG